MKPGNKQETSCVCAKSRRVILGDEYPATRPFPRLGGFFYVL